MKKKLILLYSIPFSLYGALALPFHNPEQTPPAPKTILSPKIVVNAASSLSWWSCPEKIILDVSSNKDFIKNNQSVAVPGFSLSVKKKFWQAEHSKTIYIGAKVNLAKRSNAIKTDYYDHDETQARLEVHQDIKSIRIAPFAEWLLQQTRFSLSVWIAPTIGIRGVERFRW